MRVFCTAISISLMAACSGGPGPVTDASRDAIVDTSVPMDAADSGFDAGRDSAIVDSGMDASAVDAGIDATIVDAGPDVPTCACSTGPCCDGCNFRPVTYACGTNEPFPRSCDHTSMWCGGKALTLYVAQVTTYCTGASSVCNGIADDTSYSVDCSQPTPGDFQQYGVCMPANGPTPARCALVCGT